MPPADAAPHGGQQPSTPGPLLYPPSQAESGPGKVVNTELRTDLMDAKQTQVPSFSFASWFSLRVYKPSTSTTAGNFLLANVRGFLF